MAAIDSLKQKVLSLAIQGKLVPQDPSDEPASELLKKIKAEKDALVKAGKIKKDKQESYIYKDDNKYYEKCGPETKDITDEIPFEIPDSWEWVRLSSMCRLDNGEKVSDVHLPLLDAKYLRGKSTENMMSSGILVNKDDYLILVDGENSGEVFKSPIRGIMGTTFKKLYISSSMYNSYILYLLKYYQVMFRNSKRGAAIPHLDKELFSNLLVGLPPLNEQKRIVAKIEEVFAEIDAVKDNQEALDKLKSGLKNRLLDLAIQGKLVPQDPSDEPASELLKKIQAEKTELIKQGKIKKDKQESYIYKGQDNRHYEKCGTVINDITDEIPFEIPDSWQWVRLGQIFHIILGQSPDGNSVNTKLGIEFHQGKVFFGDKYLNKSNQYTQKPNKIVPANTVLLCVRAPVGIVNITEREICIGRGLAGIVSFTGISTDFIYDWLRACKDIFISKATGTTFIAITSEVIQNQLIPLPPLNEQKQIVEKIEQFNKYIDNL
jgi:type I restriction enzyme S subunit